MVIDTDNPESGVIIVRRAPVGGSGWQIELPSGRHERMPTRQRALSFLNNNKVFRTATVVVIQDPE